MLSSLRPYDYWVEDEQYHFLNKTKSGKGAVHFSTCIVCCLKGKNHLPCMGDASVMGLMRRRKLPEPGLRNNMNQLRQAESES